MPLSQHHISASHMKGVQWVMFWSHYGENLGMYFVNSSKKIRTIPSDKLQVSHMKLLRQRPVNIWEGGGG